VYCLRVSPGTEKRQVGKTSEGFLPMYNSMNEKGRIGKHLVVPGYVFTPNYVPGTVQVPEDEWKIIDALSDPQPSVLDHANRLITEGPLQAIQGEITELEAERINVCVRLLGENRQYWLVVTPLDQETADTYRKPVAEEPAEDKQNGAKATNEKVKMEYTPEQEAEMIARSEEVGIRQTAEEYSVNWQVIAGMKRRARSKSGIAKSAVKTDSDPVRKPGKARKADGKLAKGVVSSGMPAVPKDAEGLKIQNAVLRERAEKLEAEVEKLSKALHELL